MLACDLVYEHGWKAEHISSPSISQSGTAPPCWLIALKEAFRRTRQDHPFAMPAFVVLPSTSTAFGGCRRVMAISPCDGALSNHASHAAYPGKNDGRKAAHPKASEEIWQRRYWEQLVRNEAHFQRCMDYIHYNPIKHGHVTHPLDWPYSSFRHWVERGIYPMHWAMPSKAGLLPSERSWVDEANPAYDLKRFCRCHAR